MSRRLKELAERQAALQERCAAQRGAIASEVQSIQDRLQLVNRVAALTQTVLRDPAVLVVGAAGLLWLGRARGFRPLARGILLGAAVRRVLRLVEKL